MEASLLSIQKSIGQLSLADRQMQDAKDRQLDKKVKTDKIALKRTTPIKQRKTIIVLCFIGVILWMCPLQVNHFIRDINNALVMCSNNNNFVKFFTLNN